MLFKHKHSYLYSLQWQYTSKRFVIFLKTHFCLEFHGMYFRQAQSWWWPVFLLQCLFATNLSLYHIRFRWRQPRWVPSPAQHPPAQAGFPHYTAHRNRSRPRQHDLWWREAILAAIDPHEIFSMNDLIFYMLSHFIHIYLATTELLNNYAHVNNMKMVFIPLLYAWCVNTALLRERKMSWCLIFVLSFVHIQKICLTFKWFFSKETIILYTKNLETEQ